MPQMSVCMREKVGVVCKAENKRWHDKLTYFKLKKRNIFVMHDNLTDFTLKKRNIFVMLDKLTYFTLKKKYFCS